jgi:phospholipid/cholesterol/gamma-HCH transport system substrate-binding protein
MLKARTPLLVGLLVIAAIAAFIFTFGSLDRGMSEEDSYTVFARFDDASGLAPGSRIMIAGIEVGRLGTPTLDPDNAARARVPLIIRKDVVLRKGIWDEAAHTWRNGATAVRRQSSLIGDYDVTISPGLDGEIIADGGEILNAISESGLGAVIGKIEESSKAIFPNLERITSDISAVTGSLRETIGDEKGTEALGRIRDDVEKTTRNVSELTSEIRSFMKESIYPRGDNIERILTALERASNDLAQVTNSSTQRIDRVLGRIEELSGDIRTFVKLQTAAPGEAAPGTLPKVLAGLDRNMELVGESLENIKKVTDGIENGQGTIGRLMTDDGIATSLERVLGDIEDLTSPIGRTRIGVQFRTDYLVRSGGFKSIFDFNLQASPDKSYLLQLIDDPSGRAKRFTRVTTSNDPRLPPVLVEDVIETTSDFKISAMFAKRWHFMTFRFGVLESSGGGGLDFDFFDDSLKFQADVFNFGRDTWPRLRLMAQWEFLPHMVLTAGLDDTLNDASRDWFIGLGVRFDDTDLKSLVPFLPSP